RERAAAVGERDAHRERQRRSEKKEGTNLHDNLRGIGKDCGARARRGPSSPWRPAAGASARMDIRASEPADTDAARTSAVGCRAGAGQDPAPGRALRGFPGLLDLAFVDLAAPSARRFG